MMQICMCMYAFMLAQLKMSRFRYMSMMSMCMQKPMLCKRKCACLCLCVCMCMCVCLCVWTIWKDVKPLFSIFEFTFWFVYIIPVQAGGPSMYCERWSNEAATVHADITADHRDVPASFFHVIFRDVPWLTQEPSCRVLKMKVTIWFRWMCCI